MARRPPETFARRARPRRQGRFGLRLRARRLAAWPARAVPSARAAEPGGVESVTLPPGPGTATCARAASIAPVREGGQGEACRNSIASCGRRSARTGPAASDLGLAPASSATPESAARRRARPAAASRTSVARPDRRPRGGVGLAARRAARAPQRRGRSGPRPATARPAAAPRAPMPATAAARDHVVHRAQPLAALRRRTPAAAAEYGRSVRSSRWSSPSRRVSARSSARSRAAPSACCGRQPLARDQRDPPVSASRSTTGPARGSSRSRGSSSSMTMTSWRAAAALQRPRAGRRARSRRSRTAPSGV